jgi:hypothetical protein
VKTSVRTSSDVVPPTAKPFRPGDVLTSSGLRALLDGFRARQRQHLASVHGIWGVLTGLGVTTASTDAQGRPCVVVDPGVALDASGRLRTLDRSTTVGAPPAGEGPWGLVLAFPAEDGPSAPRWVSLRRDSELHAPPRSIELARWCPGEDVEFSHRPVAWRPGARNSDRIFGGTVGLGSLPVLTLPDQNGWSVRVDTSSALLSGSVAYLVFPVPPTSGAAWSVTSSWNDAFVFETANWPIPAADPNAKAIPTLPVALSWIGVETGSARLGLPVSASSARTSSMNGSAATTSTDSPTDGPIRGPAPQSTDAFAVPRNPPFVAKTLLTAGDLTQSVAFLNAMQSMHNRLLHDWGIAGGLGVSAGAGSDGSPFQVDPGLAVDGSGREFLLDTSYQIDAPIEVASQSTGPWLLVLHAPTDPGSPLGVLTWRNPMARSGPRVLQTTTDVVLASATFKAGKLASALDASVRRPVRPTAPPSVLAGSTVPGATDWSPYFAGQQTDGAKPSGIKSHVTANVPQFVVLGQLVGSRYDATTRRAYDGPCFVTNQDAAGFDFVVLFPKDLSSWGLSTTDDLKRLLDRLKGPPMQWSVSWIAVSPSQ